MRVHTLQYDLFSVLFLLLSLSLLILSLPLLGLGSKSTSLSPGFCYVGQSNTVQFVGSLIFFQDFFCFFLVNCLGRWNQ